MAFDLISRPDLMKGSDPIRQVRIIQELAFGSGNLGMVGGQVFDIQAENKDIDLPTLQNIHKHKTGMLIRAAVRMGVITSYSIHYTKLYDDREDTQLGLDGQGANVRRFIE